MIKDVRKVTTSMTQQFKDPFIWKSNEWAFVRAYNSKSLFDPKKFGLSPNSLCTACRKGYVVQFKVNNNILYLDNLKIFCKDNFYPRINNVAPKLYTVGLEKYKGMQEYKNINLELKYNGTIIIAREMKEEFYTRYFIDPNSYEITFELYFEDGKLVESRETSGTYFGFSYIWWTFFRNSFRKLLKFNFRNLLSNKTHETL